MGEDDEDDDSFTIDDIKVKVDKWEKDDLNINVISKILSNLLRYNIDECSCFKAIELLLGIIYSKEYRNCSNEIDGLITAFSNDSVDEQLIHVIINNFIPVFKKTFDENIDKQIDYVAY